MPITNDDTLWIPHRHIHTVIKPPKEEDNLVIISISPEGFVHKLVAHNGKIETIQIEY